MWKRKMSICLSLLLFCLPSVGMCAESTETVPKTLLIQALTDWQTSIDELEILLTEQEKELTVASEELESLRNLISKQREQLTALRTELTDARNETKNAKKSLERANQELKSITDGVKDIEGKKRLAERQRNLWQVIAAALGIVCIAK